MTHGDAAEAIRTRLLAAIDRLVEIADRHGGLLPSVLDAQTGEMPQAPPPAIPGQREGDRARWGCNLMHDHPLLLAIDHVGRIASRPAYVDAVERYLHRFAAHCTNTPSGLFPWGEHAYWRLDRDAVGNSIAEAGANPDYPIIHDHLRAAPLWLWQRLDALNPACVQRFAHGLDLHFKAGRPHEFSRHACLEGGDPRLAESAGFESSGRPKRLTGPRDGANDFPRHSGFYALDTAFAWSRSGDPALKAHLLRCLDYWWCQREDARVLPLQSRGPGRLRLGIQTLSLAHSLFEVAHVLESAREPATSLAAEARHRAQHYTELCLLPDASDDLPALRDPQAPAWGSTYGHQRPVVCRYPMLYTGVYRLHPDPRLLEVAVQLATKLADTPLPAGELAVPASDVGMGLGAMVDLSELTGDAVWLERGLALGQQALATYFTHPLPVGASGTHWYEAQLGTGCLMLNLARLCYRAQSPHTRTIPPDYSYR